MQKDYKNLNITFQLLHVYDILAYVEKLQQYYYDLG